MDILSILLFLDHWNILYTLEVYPALIINQSGIRKGFMPNDHSTSVEFSSYKACLLLILMNFMDFQFPIPCVFLFRYMIIKLILKSHDTFNPHFKFIYRHEEYILFLFRFKSPHFSSNIIIPENSISVGGSVLLEFIFSPAVASFGSLGKQNLSGRLRSLKILDCFSNNYNEIILMWFCWGVRLVQKFSQFFVLLIVFWLILCSLLSFFLKSEKIDSLLGI